MTTVIDINPRAGYITIGEFDTRYRYLRNGTDVDRFPVPKEDTFVVTTNPTAQPMPNWRYSNGVTSRAYTVSGGTPIVYDPDYTLVNL